MLVNNYKLRPSFIGRFLYSPIFKYIKIRINILNYIYGCDLKES